MNLFWTVWEILINVLEYGALFYLLRKALGYSRKKKPFAIGGLFVCIALVTAMNFLAVDFIAVIVIMFAVVMFYAVFSFGGSISARILWGLIGFSVPQVTNLIVSNLLPMFSGMNIVDTLSPSPARFGVQVFYIFVIIALDWTLSRIPRKNIEISTPLLYQFIVLVISAIGVFTVGQIVGYAIRAERTADDRLVLVIISFAILIMLLSVIFLFDKVGRASYEKAEVENQLKIAAMEEASVKSSKELISAWHHDVCNHIEVLQQYAANDDIPNIKKRLGEMHRSADEIIAVQSTGNPSIDACIASKLIIARANNIPTTTCISHIEGCAIPEAEISTVLGNLLSNAIEACRAVEDETQRYIDITVNMVRGMVHVDILNSTSGSYSYSNNRLASTKTEPGHGKGLSGMDRILKKYGAFYQLDPGSDYFQVKIFIPTE